jgi:hypothetical protein
VPAGVCTSVAKRIRIPTLTLHRQTSGRDRTCERIAGGKTRRLRQGRELAQAHGGNHTLVHPAGPCARRLANPASDAWWKVCSRRMAVAGAFRATAGGGAAVLRSVPRLPADRPAGAPGSAPAKLALCRRTPWIAGSPCGSKPLRTPLAAGGAIAHLPGCGMRAGAGCRRQQRTAGSARSLLFRHGRRDARHHSRLCCGTGCNEGGGDGAGLRRQ